MRVDTDAYLAKCVEDYYGVDTDTVEDHECEFCEETHDFEVDSCGEGVCPNCGHENYFEEYDNPQ